MSRNYSLTAILAIFGIAAAGAISARADDFDRHHGNDTAYVQTNLVSDLTGIAKTMDPLLVNPWGIAFVPGGPFWIADNGRGVATLYDGAGIKVPATFTIPPPHGAPKGSGSAPTGMIWNQTFQFLVPNTTLPALFIFATEDGTISAWAPNEPTNPLQAVLAVDNSKSSAVYKGLAAGTNSQGNFLYATNFHTGTIDVFDSKFAPANAQLTGKFQDLALPAGYAPFGIRNIDGNLWVTFALQDAAKHDDVGGPGHGFVDIFDTDGHLLRRFAAGHRLNSPWGLTRAPFGFGQLSGDILIGNFGDGKINAYRSDGTFDDAVEDRQSQPLVIHGLWALQFGGGLNSSPQTLYFTAGIKDEAHGLYGKIAPSSPDIINKR
jgi:uncharacterized protein (TIGR03118 family)